VSDLPIIHGSPGYLVNKLKLTFHLLYKLPTSRIIAICWKLKSLEEGIKVKDQTAGCSTAAATAPAMGMGVMRLLSDIRVLAYKRISLRIKLEARQTALRLLILHVTLMTASAYLLSISSPAFASRLPASIKQISGTSTTFYLNNTSSPLQFMMYQSSPSNGSETNGNTTISFYSDTWDADWELDSGTTSVTLTVRTQTGRTPTYTLSLKAGSDGTGWTTLGTTDWTVSTSGAIQEKTTSFSTDSYTFNEGDRLVFEVQIPAFAWLTWDGATDSRISIPDITSGVTPTPSATSTATHTHTHTATSTSTPTATSTNTPDCELISELSYYTDDKVFYSVLQNENDAYPNLVRSILYWPDDTYDFHFVKNYFPYYSYSSYIYLEQNQYTSPVDSGTIDVAWPADARPTAEWAARFVLDDGSEISGAFAADLSFSFPSWGTCSIQVGDTSAIPTPTASATPTNTATPGGSVNINNVTFAETALTGQDFILSGSTTAWSMESTYNPGTSWHLNITATDLSDGTHTLDASNLKIRLLNSSIIILSGNDKPSSAIESFISLSNDAQTLLQYGGTDGQGSYEFTPEFQLLVPGEAYAGQYSSTITTTFVVGP